MNTHFSEAEGAAVPAKKPSLLRTFTRGLWSDNPGLCQLLGLCPLLAVSGNAVSALGLGLATLFVVCLSSVIISLLRSLILREVRIPLYIVLIATLVTVLRFYVEAFYPDLYDSLGIYLSLIVTNCIIMGRAEAVAGRENVLRSFLDSAGCGLGFALVLFCLGSVREIAGSGTWMTGAGALLGDWAAPFETVLYSHDYTYLIAVLPPGGFFVLALFIALKNAFSIHRRNRIENRFRIDSVRD
ncbi:MAG: electron transport complex subunit E [Succinivibrio sp.]|jgi:electron transport complex protein RnfE|nr:electron transport complex subunit E [Succinivibrio sp.]